MRFKNPFVIPTSPRGARRAEYGIIAAGIALAIVAAAHAVAVRSTQGCSKEGASPFDKVPRALLTTLVKEVTK